jgi:hypothetical protein
MSMKPKCEEKPKDEVDKTVVAVVESGCCCWIPKSNYSKENERNNPIKKKGVGGGGGRPSGFHREGLERG